MFAQVKNVGNLLDFLLIYLQNWLNGNLMVPKIHYYINIICDGMDHWKSYVGLWAQMLGCLNMCWSSCLIYDGWKKTTFYERTGPIYICVCLLMRLNTFWDTFSVIIALYYPIKFLMEIVEKILFLTYKCVYEYLS